jgi:hypothetical protein
MAFESVLSGKVYPAGLIFSLLLSLLLTTFDKLLYPDNPPVNLLFSLLMELSVTKLSSFLDLMIVVVKG